MIIDVPPLGPLIRRASAPPGKLLWKKGKVDGFLKYFTFFFYFVNFVFVVSGITIVYIWALSNAKEMPISELTFLDDKIQRTTQLMLTVGAILLITGLVGCWGAALGNRCLLYMFGVNVMVMVLIEMGTFAFFSFGKKDLASALKLALDKELLLYGDKNNGDSHAFVDTYQKFYGCCGAESGDDFKKTPWYPSRTDLSIKVPESCCAPDTPCQKGNIHKNNPYTGTGCVVAIQNYLYKKGAVVMGGLTAIIMFQLLSVCTASCIMKAYSDKEDALDDRMQNLYSRQ